MTSAPGSDEVFVSDEEVGALTPEALDALGDRALQDDLVDLEQQIQNDVADQWWRCILNRTVPVEDLLSDHFVRELHRQLYAPVWTWGGRQRTLETNIGVAPEYIAVEMRMALGNLAHQWDRETGIDARTLGIAAHAALVRVHPFADGNGRVTRLLADLIFLAAQPASEPLVAYDWSIDQPTYIRLLRQYDRTRDPEPLTKFVPVVKIE